MTDQNLLLSEDGYPNAPADIKPSLLVAAENVCVIGPLTMSKLLSDASAHIEQLERDNHALLSAAQDDIRAHNRLVDRIAELERELVWARKGLDRYEYMRTLNVPQFTALYKANISGNGRFDDLVDAAMKDKP